MKTSQDTSRTLLSICKCSNTYFFHQLYFVNTSLFTYSQRPDCSKRYCSILCHKSQVVQVCQTDLVHDSTLFFVNTKLPMQSWCTYFHQALHNFPFLHSQSLLNYNHSYLHSSPKPFLFMTTSNEDEDLLCRY